MNPRSLTLSRLIVGRIVPALLLLAVAAPLSAQDLGSPELFRSRRARFAAAMQPGAIAIVMSARKNQD
ncbi:MAG: hypothetical protein ACRD26_05985, partial [Vicinamibacterales bacterium]